MLSQRFSAASLIKSACASDLGVILHGKGFGPLNNFTLAWVNCQHHVCLHNERAAIILARSHRLTILAYCFVDIEHR